MPMFFVTFKDKGYYLDWCRGRMQRTKYGFNQKSEIKKDPTRVSAKVNPVSKEVGRVKNQSAELVKEIT
jgi:hypothetical protein